MSGASSPHEDMNMTNLLLDEIVTESDGSSITLSYLKEGGLGSELRTMKKSLRRWVQEYLTIVMAGTTVRWNTSKEVDPTGGDRVRIWTEDLKGTSLEDDCDFIVWQMPDDTVGEDFIKFLSRTN